MVLARARSAVIKENDRIVLELGVHEGRPDRSQRAFIQSCGVLRVVGITEAAAGAPLIPGVDAVVRSADGVLAYSGFPEPPYGTLAERISVPSFLWVPIPEGADPALIAGGLNPGMAS